MEDKRVIKKRIIRLRSLIREELDDPVVVEMPLTIYLNGRELVTLLCTPEKIDRLALGFLRSEGLIKSLDDLADIRCRYDDGLVEVELKEDSTGLESLYSKRTITSGCGKGTIFYNVIDSLRSEPLTGKLQVPATKAMKVIRELEEKALLFKATGGVHSAALASGDQIIFFYEDIGRHNAVDKIIGECLNAGIEMDGKYLVVSGRISSEILLKAAKLKIELLISRSAPTSLSIELAESLNITIAGFTRGQRMNLYTHPWRIIDE